ncbi:MAG TPA: tetratricopeptide repeat protein, partial [Casimicrobiaceae bacterium]|nr:tetratricopeptide repeat protein [Casimicrobiaceae bacterium]
MSGAYAEWIARGRTHQIEGRPVDAMLCFRRALRDDETGREAWFHLGEVLWQLGRLPDAVSAWYRSAQADPDFAPAWQALTEARLGLGESRDAYEAAARALALDAADRRARLLGGIAGLVLAERAEVFEHEATLVAAVDASPELLALPAAGGTLALSLDRRSRPRVLDAVVRQVGTGAVRDWPLHLIAVICEYVAEANAATGAARALFESTAGRAIARNDVDAMRRIARIARRLADPRAVPFASVYADACVTHFRPPTPILWPRRTAGEALRVVVVGRADAEDELPQRVARALPRGAVVSMAVVGMATSTLAHGADDRMLLSPRPDLNDARRVAQLDADLLIDGVGMDAAIGPFLAARPARRILTLPGLPSPNVGPLIDDVWPESNGFIASPFPTVTATVDAQSLAQLWSAAVDAHQRGDLDAAASGYRRVLDVEPGHAPASYLIGVIERERGRIAQALECFRDAVEQAPAYEDARIAAIDAAATLGDRAAADALISLDAHASTPLLRAAGAAALRFRDADRAVAFLDSAARRDPTDADTQFNLGAALQMARRYADAARSYQRALAFRPDLIAADFNLGAIFSEQGNRLAAIAAYRQVIARDPKHVAAYKQLGEALLTAGQIDVFIDNFRRFESSCPEALSLAVQALEACQYSADFARLERYLDDLRDERFVATNEQELVDCLEQLLHLLLYFDVDPETIHRFSTTYDATAQHVYGGALPASTQRKPGRIRIGYLSADLRNHVMGKMMWQAVQHHDRDRFELYFYSLSSERDAWTDKFEQLADRFETIARLDENAAARRIADDDLDLLVDLSTHTKGGRPAILARKPARVQVTHVANAGTVGLSSIDFKLTDRYADLADNQRTQIETLLPMQGCV